MYKYSSVQCPRGIRKNTALLTVTGFGPLIHLAKKESCNRPGVAQRVPGGLGSQIHDIRHMKVVKLSASCSGRI